MLKIKKSAFSGIVGAIFLLTALLGQPLADEPSKSEYICMPVFMARENKPNILVVLDNSGSMNYNAYGAYPGNGKEVTGAPYMGEPHCAAVDNKPLAASILGGDDDIEQEGSSGGGTGDMNMTSGNINFGWSGSGSWARYSHVAFRFRDVPVERLNPPDVELDRAWLDLVAYNDVSGGKTHVTIYGDKSGDSPAIEDDDYEISSRTTTDASVYWEMEDEGDWDKYEHYTVEVTPIVQELLSRSDWDENNAITFIIEMDWSETDTDRQVYAYNSSSSRSATLKILLKKEVDPSADAEKYYGYFNPDYFYVYDDGQDRFEHKYKKNGYDPDADGGDGAWNILDLDGSDAGTLTDNEIVTEKLWDGNWMNWAASRRVDILRKVMFGGQADDRNGTGNQTLTFEEPAQTNRTFRRPFDTGGIGGDLRPPVTPYDGDYWYGFRGYSGDGYDCGKIYVDDDSDPFSSAIEIYPLQVNTDHHYEPDDFTSWDCPDGQEDCLNLAGVMQKVGDRANWGDMKYNSSEYGRVMSAVGTPMIDIIDNLENRGCNTNTPLAETLYVGMKYFAQNRSGLPSSSFVMDNTNDPYHDNELDIKVPCAPSFVLFLTDGASTQDRNIPTWLRDYDGDGNESSRSYDSSGSDYMDDVALYMAANDLRSDLEGDQFLNLYVVYAFGGEEDNARPLLMDAARNGGFEDKNGNGEPDGDYDDPPGDRLEWDKDGDEIPDAYYEASDGYALQEELLSAINAMLKRAGSATAVSVLATSGEGEGSVVQAYFKPRVNTGEVEELKWLGYLQSLWVDAYGNLREDTDGDDAYDERSLDVAKDRVVKYHLDEGSGNTEIHIWEVSSGNPYPDTTTAPDHKVEIDAITPIWEGGRRLAEMQEKDDSQGHIESRTIRTSLDGDTLIDFTIANAEKIKPYLGVADDAAWSHLGATHDDRVKNIINWVRGVAVEDLRSREIDHDKDGFKEVWKLGDIVHSTPVAYSYPLDNYNVIYSDEDYQTFFQDNKNREMVVYVGANDGMLHAFTSWLYDPIALKFTKPGSAPNTELIGDELWAYIPKSLLPHLKWLPDNNYGHIYYVDLKPKIFDAKIAGVNNDEWGSFMLVGLGLGGGEISVTNDFGSGSETKTFYPTYSLFDITDPRDPDLIWERSYDNLGRTMSYPAVVRVEAKKAGEEKWYAVFGSGPNGPNFCDGESVQNGYIYIVDLVNGNPESDPANAGVDWFHDTGVSNAFMASAASMDKNLNFSVDATYIGMTHGTPGDWGGKMYKITVPRTSGGDSYDKDVDYIIDPNASDHWLVHEIFETPQDTAITAAPSLSIDGYRNTWIYFGTGRYLSQADKVDQTQQYMFGIKDPFFNLYQCDPEGPYENTTGSVTKCGGVGYHSYNSSHLFTMDTTNLFDADSVTIKENDTGAWNTLLTEVRTKYDGWYRELPDAGERMINKPAVFGGMVFSPSYVPSNDVCDYGGDSYLYGLYYETGTAYYEAAFEDGIEEVSEGGETFNAVNYRIQLGKGKASSLGIHVGKNEDAKGLLQQSTGVITELLLDPPLEIRSALQSWIER